MVNKLDEHLDLLKIRQLKDNRKIFLALGIVFIVLGTLAVYFSYFTTIFSVIYFGVFLMALGFFEAIHSWSVNKGNNFFLHLFLGILYLVGGAFIVANPTVNAISLTLLLSIFLMVSGILKIIFAFSKDLPHKGWIAFNGILACILGILIWQQWPSSGLWVIGLYVGIDTIFVGWSLIMLSLIGKKFANEKI